MNTMAHRDGEPHARWSRLAIGVVAVALCSVTVTASAAPASPKIDTHGPAGLAFYTPPLPLPAGAHGDLIWARPVANDAKLASAAQNWLVLYRSTDINGNPVAVSGTVSIPQGTPPKGGWPIISWTHGTVGMADACAPSHNNDHYEAHNYADLMNRDLNHWLQQGYAVAQTDYQGLGTPGIHPYLVGDSEARSATDIVYAARQLNAGIGPDWIVMGHSQGGGAAAYTAYLGPIYGQGLHLRAAVAIAPDSYVALRMQYVEKSPDLSTAGMGWGILMFRSMASIAPGVKLDKLLTPAGQKVAALAGKECPGVIDKYIKAHKLDKMKDLLDMKADFGPLNTALSALVDVENVRPTVSLLVIQADNDEAAVKKFTDKMVARYKVLGVPVSYHVVHIAHRGKLTASNHEATIPQTRAYAMQWVARYLLP